MSRRPMSITSNRTEETAYCSGIRATGRASVTDTTVSKPETKTTPLSTSTESKPHLLALQFRQAQGCTYGAGLGLGQPAGGRSKSLKTEQHKTVGPSRVKKREIAGPPVYWDPDSARLQTTISHGKRCGNLVIPCFPDFCRIKLRQWHTYGVSLKIR